jgi:uncharacterized protein YggU (UPF0235/DUF167 family)
MYVRVRVKAGARKERIEQVSETEWQMAVREPAERNLANGKIRELLAGAYSVRPEDVRIITGHHSPTKIFDVPK